MNIDKQSFLGVAAGVGAMIAASSCARAQSNTAVDDLGRNSENMRGKPVPWRKATTSELFLTPPSWPNAITADPDGHGFWVQEQKHDSTPETAWLLDMQGKVLKSVITQCVDCSRMAVGNGFVWSGANGASVHNPTNPPTEGGYTPGLVKYDIETGRPVEFVDFVPGSCDMHDVAVVNGQLHGVNAGEHPRWPITGEYNRSGWPGLNSPSAGWVFRIDII